MGKQGLQYLTEPFKTFMEDIILIEDQMLMYL